jgi:hypothetical protein
MTKGEKAKRGNRETDKERRKKMKNWKENDSRLGSPKTEGRTWFMASSLVA